MQRDRSSLSIPPLANVLGPEDAATDLHYNVGRGITSPITCRRDGQALGKDKLDKIDTRLAAFARAVAPFHVQAIHARFAPSDNRGASLDRTRITRAIRQMTHAIEAEPTLQGVPVKLAIGAHLTWSDAGRPAVLTRCEQRILDDSCKTEATTAASHRSLDRVTAVAGDEFRAALGPWLWDSGLYLLVLSAVITPGAAPNR